MTNTKLMYNPKELFFRASTPDLTEFKLAEPEIRTLIACPDPPEEALAAGKAIAVPMGQFDAKLVLHQLPDGYQPDIVHISARDMDFRPLDLDCFGCPTVMKIGDTFHWGDGTLSGILSYCKDLQCDYHWVYQGVQHLHFFVEAGLKNVFWLPGTPVIETYVPQPSSAKPYDVVFRGSRSALHIYRSYLLDELENSKFNVDIQTKPYRACLEDYTKTKIVFNCGLNSDSNRRIFEVLMAGGFLLTDRLSQQSGLFSLFEEGTHLECYGSLEELFQKIDFYLKNPQKAEEIAALGHQKFMKYYSQKSCKEKFYRYILDGEIEHPFLLQQDKRIDSIPLSNFDSHMFEMRLKTYELVQELHRLNPNLEMLYWKGGTKELLSDLADLPRLTLSYAGDQSEVSMMEEWCLQTSVNDGISFFDKDVKKQRFQVILMDQGSVKNLEKHLSHLQILLADGGLVLVVGDWASCSRLPTDKVMSQKGFIAVEPCFANFKDKLGGDVCIAYQKAVDSSKNSLNYNRLTTLKKIVNSLRSLKPRLAS